MSGSPRKIGVAIVTYRSAGVIDACLESLAAQDGVELRVVVVDNASDDGTCRVIRDWARGRGVALAEAELGEARAPESWLTLVRAPVNRGFAWGTNRALELLMQDRAIDLFWLLNPDARAAPDAAAQYCEAASDGDFALMGSRTFYVDQPEVIQSEGGYLSRLTGRCTLANRGIAGDKAQAPDAARLDYFSGANLVASRRFIERAGLMDEGYFLYYEEVDWALRRGDLPLRLVDGARVYHKGGTATGSATHTRPASPFANYFNYRSRMRFMRRHFPRAVLIARAFAVAKAAQLALRGDRAGARSILAALGLAAVPEEVEANS